MEHIFAIAALVAYGVASFRFVRRLRPDGSRLVAGVTRLWPASRGMTHDLLSTQTAAQPLTGTHGIDRVWLFLAVVCHLIALLLSVVISPASSLQPALFSGSARSLPFVASAAGVTVCGLFLLLERRRPEWRSLGAFVAPVTLFLMVWSSFSFHGAAVYRPFFLPATAVFVHLIGALAGLSLLLFSCGVSAAVLVQERLLRKKRALELLSNFPSVVSLDWLNRRLLLWGFALFSISSVLGLFGMLAAGETDAVLRDPRLYCVFVSMAVYGALLIGIFRFGYRGSRAAMLSLLGGTVVLSAFVWGGMVGGNFHAF